MDRAQVLYFQPIYNVIYFLISGTMCNQAIFTEVVRENIRQNLIILVDNNDGHELINY